MKRCRSRFFGALVLIAVSVVLAPARADAAAASQSVAQPASQAGGLARERDPFDETRAVARPGRLVVRPASDYRDAVVPAWWTRDPAASLVLRAPSQIREARIRSLAVEIDPEPGETRLAFSLEVHPAADGNLELRMPPGGLPAGRYKIALYDASAPDYRWPLVEYRVEVE